MLTGSGHRASNDLWSKHTLTAGRTRTRTRARTRRWTILRQYRSLGRLTDAVICACVGNEDIRWLSIAGHEMALLVVVLADIFSLIQSLFGWCVCVCVCSLVFVAAWMTYSFVPLLMAIDHCSRQWENIIFSDNSTHYDDLASRMAQVVITPNRLSSVALWLLSPPLGGRL